MSLDLYWVKCNVDTTGIGPTAGDVLVVAEDKMDAVEKAKGDDKIKRLWNEDLARAEARGEDLSRQNEGQVRKAEYIGEIPEPDTKKVVKEHWSVTYHVEEHDEIVEDTVWIEPDDAWDETDRRDYVVGCIIEETEYTYEETIGIEHKDTLEVEE